MKVWQFQEQGVSTMVYNPKPTSMTGSPRFEVSVSSTKCPTELGFEVL